MGNNHRDWDVGLSQYAMALRTALHESTGFSPAYLNLGRELRTPADIGQAVPPDVVMNPDRIHKYARSLKTIIDDAQSQAQQNLEAQQIRQPKYYNAHHRDVEFNIGDSVLKRTHFLSNAGANFSKKLAPISDGPFIIAEKLSPLTYRLKGTKNNRTLKGTFHIRDLKPYTERIAGDISKLQSVESSSENELSEVITPKDVARDADNQNECALSVVSDKSDEDTGDHHEQVSPNVRSLRPRDPLTGRAMC